MTARALLALVQPFGPTIEAGELAFEMHPPPDLDQVLQVLHTGVRHLLCGRKWYGERSDGPRLITLNPSAPIPKGITLLCVEGDERWDRINPAALLNLPELFEAQR